MSKLGLGVIVGVLMMLALTGWKSMDLSTRHAPAALQKK
jgi:hypothetical protein